MTNQCYQRDGFSAAGWNAKSFYPPPQHYYGTGYDNSMLYSPQGSLNDQHNLHHVSQAYPAQQSQPQSHENQNQSQRQSQHLDTSSGMYGVTDSSYNQEKGKLFTYEFHLNHFLSSTILILLS